MSSPISAGEILAIAQFAFRLWQSCKAAPSEFQQVGKEVFATRTIIELVHIECQDPESMINVYEKKPQRPIRKQLGVYVRNCEEALKAVDALLKRYDKMGLTDKVLWALKGKSEVALLEADLSSFASQLDSYVNKIILGGVGVVNKNLGNVNKNLLSGLGRLEDLIEKYGGNEKAAVAEAMKERQKCGSSKKERERSQTIMEEYATEMSRAANDYTPTEGTVRPTTPDPPRDRKPSNNNLAVPKLARARAGSVDTAIKNKGPKPHVQPSKQGTKAKKPDFTLECWLVQIKTAQLIVTFEISEKERQCRGQWKLREMAKQFNSSPAKDKLAGDHDLVKWVLKDCNKKEADNNFAW